MSRPIIKSTSGFSLVELLIVIAIITLLLQMLFPAVQSVREAARRTNCANSLRNLGLAVQLYESAHMALPLANNNEPNHNCVQFLLPYLEQAALFDKYDFDEDWDSERNQPLTDTELNILRCPTAPRDYPYVSDYAVCVQVDKVLAQEMAAEGLIRERNDLIGLLRHTDEKRTFSDVTDGLSNTIVFCEMSGRPDRYELGVLTKVNDVPGSRWGDNEAPFSIGKRSNGRELQTGSQLMNVTSATEIYSFHNQGANFTFGDGSTRFIAEDIDPDALVSLITASEGD